MFSLPLWLILILCPSVAQTKPVRISLCNGDLEEKDEAGRPLNWQVVGDTGSARIDEIQCAQGAHSLRMEAAPGRELQVLSQPLPLAPLRRYRLDLWVKRTQGHDLFFVVQAAKPSGQVLPHDLHLHWPGRYQPNWFPPAPFWTKYEAFFATGRGETAWRLAIRHHCRDDRLGRGNWIDGITLHEIGKVFVRGERVPVQNLLPITTSEFAPDANGWPLGWDLWWGDKTMVKVIPRSGPEEVQYLQVRMNAGGGGSLGLAGGFVPVQEGFLHRFSIQARGRGTVSLGMHQIGNAPGDTRAETGLRIGSSHPRTFEVDVRDWQTLEGEWIAEIPGVRWLNPYLPISGEIEIRNVSVQVAP